jgi:hypothetical protein
MVVVKVHVANPRRSPQVGDRLRYHQVGKDQKEDRRHRVEAPEDFHQSQRPRLRTGDRVLIKVPPGGISEAESPHQQARLLAPVLAPTRPQAAHLPASVSSQLANPSRIARSYPRVAGIALAAGPVAVSAGHHLGSLLSRETMVHQI